MEEQEHPVVLEEDESKQDEKAVIIQKEELRELVVQMSENPLADKIQPEHIQKSLENDELEIRAEMKLTIAGYVHSGAVLLITAAFIVALVLLLRDKDGDTLVETLKLFGAFAAGAFGGYGFGKKNS